MKWGWLLACAGLGLLALTLQWHFSVFPLDGPHDSLRYLGMAETLLKGDWLGPYDHMTLIRSPVYSFFLAFNSLAGWRLHVFQQAAYLAGVLLLCFSLKSYGMSAWRIALIFGLCAFHPLPLYCTGFVTPEALYVPAAMGVVSACAGLMMVRDGSPLIWTWWVLILSISLSIFWHIRPEGIWILPFLFVCGSFLFRKTSSTQGIPWKRNVMAILLPGIIVYLLGYGLSSRNEKHYGIRVTHELAESQFREAFQWLTRLAPEDHKPFVPVSNAGLAMAYEVSPHFGRLEPHLALHLHGQGWSGFGCDWMGICDELAGGWAVWAIRDAAARTGVHESARNASQFYEAVAEEIRVACEKRRVPCSRNPTGNMLAPPMTLRDLPRIGGSLIKVMLLTFGFGDFAIKREDWEVAHQDAALVRRYERMTHDQDFKPNALPYGKLANASVAVYRVFPFAAGLMVVFALFLFVRRGGKPHESAHVRLTGLPFLWLGCCLAVYILGRWSVVAYVDAMSFSAHIRYLLVVYPVLMVLLGLVIPPWNLKRKEGGSRGE